MPEVKRSEHFQSFLQVRKVEGKGRGVFALTRFQKGQTVEQAPVIVLSAKDYKLAAQTKLYEYLFGWDEETKEPSPSEQQNKEGGAVALGYGSLYNHSDTPNLLFVPDEKTETIAFVCLRDIEEGEELTISYQQRFKQNLWFEKEQ